MRSLRLLLIGCVAVAMSGCAGYRLGPSNGQTVGEKTVQVTPFTNHTPEPRLGDAVTEQLRKQLQRDGTYRLATHDAGDIVISGTLTRYYRHELSFVPNDIATARDYRVRLTAQVTARERSTGKVLFDQPVTGFTLIRVGSDLTSTERQALPLLAGDLARQITALLADGSW
ncbi:MAG: LptE family protein [Verrucomicrobiota bacterium]